MAMLGIPGIDPSGSILPSLGRPRGGEEAERSEPDFRARLGSGAARVGRGGRWGPMDASLVARVSSGGLGRVRLTLQIGPAPHDGGLAGQVAARVASSPSAFAAAGAILEAGPAGMVDNAEELYELGLPRGLGGGLAEVAFHHRADLIARVKEARDLRAEASAAAACRQRVVSDGQQQGKLRQRGEYDKGRTDRKRPREDDSAPAATGGGAGCRAGPSSGEAPGEAGEAEGGDEEEVVGADDPDDDGVGDRVLDDAPGSEYGSEDDDECGGEGEVDGSGGGVAAAAPSPAVPWLYAFSSSLLRWYWYVVLLQRRTGRRVGSYTP